MIYVWCGVAQVEMLFTDLLATFSGQVVGVKVIRAIFVVKKSMTKCFGLDGCNIQSVNVFVINWQKQPGGWIIVFLPLECIRIRAHNLFPVILRILSIVFV